MTRLVIQTEAVLHQWEYDLLERYFQLVVNKIERGRAEYGMDYLNRSDESFSEEIDEELADCSGWPAMMFLKRHAPSE